MYKAILLDFDDTLYDTHGNAQIALEVMFREFGLDKFFNSFEDFSVPYWETNVELWSQYAKGEITRDYLIMERFRRPLSLGKGLDVTPELCLAISERFLDCCTEQTGVIDGAYHVIKGLTNGTSYKVRARIGAFVSNEDQVTVKAQFDASSVSAEHIYSDNVLTGSKATANIGLPSTGILRTLYDAGLLTIGGGVMGISGMLIGVPIAAAAYRILRNDVNGKTEEEIKKAIK